MGEDFEARRAAAREDAASSSEWWSPLAAGDRVEGEVQDVSEATVQSGQGKGKVYTVLTLELANGRSQKVGCARTVLADKVAEAGIEVGDFVSITYGGERTSKGGSPYFAYTVGVVK